MATTKCISRTNHLSLQLQEIAARLKAWRQTRQPGQRIPEPLWAAAVRLARVHGLSPIATALKLSYYDLQRRVGPNHLRSKPAATGPAFVALPASPWNAGPG